MFTIAVAIVLLLAGLYFRFYWWRIVLTRACGTEADATVSRIESYKASTGGAQEFTRQFYYAVYETLSGMENEARLLNPKTSLGIGDRIRIKYLDDKADYAVLTKITDKTGRSPES